MTSRNAGVVDEQVERGMAVAHCGGQPFHRHAVRNVARLDFRVSDFLGQSVQPRCPARNEDAAPAVSCECARGRGADAARRARDDRDAVYGLQTRMPRVADRRFPCLSAARALRR